MTAPNMDINITWLHHIPFKQQRFDGITHSMTNLGFSASILGWVYPSFLDFSQQPRELLCCTIRLWVLAVTVQLL